MRIALFEDDVYYAVDTIRLLEVHDHEVVLHCKSLEDSVRALSCDSSGVLRSGRQFDIAIVDGDMGFSLSREDGARICYWLNRLQPRPVIIGNSGGGDIAGADKQVNKDPRALLEVLESTTV